MLNDIIKTVADKLSDSGVSPVYSAFDGVPAEQKCRGIYTVVGVENFSSTAPVYSLSAVYLPFRTDISIRVTAPKDMSAEKLFGYYSSKIAPALDDLSGLSCSLSKLTLKYDSNISRLVLTAILSAGGVTRIERSLS